MRSILKPFTSSVHALRNLNYYLFKKFAPWYIHNDLTTLVNEAERIVKAKESKLDGIEEKEEKWHFLHYLEFVCQHFDGLIKKYLPEFE